MICIVPTFVLKMVENVCGIYFTSSPSKDAFRKAMISNGALEDEVPMCTQGCNMCHCCVMCAPNVKEVEVPKHIRSTRVMKVVTWKTERSPWIYRHVIGPGRDVTRRMKDWPGGSYHKYSQRTRDKRRKVNKERQEQHRKEARSERRAERWQKAKQYFKDMIGFGCAAKRIDYDDMPDLEARIKQTPITRAPVGSASVFASGFNFDTRKSIRFKTRLEQISQFKAAFGHTRVPPTYGEHYNLGFLSGIYEINIARANCRARQTRVFLLNN